MSKAYQERLVQERNRLLCENTVLTNEKEDLKQINWELTEENKELTIKNNKLLMENIPLLNTLEYFDNIITQQAKDIDRLMNYIKTLKAENDVLCKETYLMGRMMFNLL